MLRREIREWFRALLRALPGRIGEATRNSWYGYRVGAKTRILSNVIIYYPEKLQLGSHSAITAYCQLNACGGIEIGDNVLIGPGSFIWSQNHNFADATRNIREQGFERAPVIIEDDVWIAARCVVLPGVRLAKGTVVAAGAVVTQSTRPYSVVAGVPAKEIKQRDFPDEQQPPPSPTESTPSETC